MILCRVIGNALAVEKHECYTGKTVLVCQPIDDKNRDVSRAFLAVDAVQAGVGDLVLASREGNTARQLAGGPNDPIHSVVLAIVDRVEMENGTTLEGATQTWTRENDARNKG